MSKFFTTVLLIAAMLVSGLSAVLQPINASATLNNPIDCNILGFYKDGTKPGRPCLACPIDFYCLGDLTRLDSQGQEIRRSPELPGVNGQQNSEVIPCPAGNTTKGFTTHPSKGTLLTVDQDGFKVGTIATNASQCHAPDFKCPADAPRLVQDLTGEQKCYASCPSGEAAILYEGVQTCGVKCRDGEATIGKKCFPTCAVNEILVAGITSQNNNQTNVVRGDGQTTSKSNSKCTDICASSSIQGQVSTPSDLTCRCPSGTVIILDTATSTSGKCGVPVPCPKQGQVKTADGQCICPSPTILNQAGTACEIPAVACDVNTYGAAKPNCTPCPADTSAPAGSKIVSDCKSNPCTIQGQTRVNGACVCASPSVINSTGTACEIPATPCPADYFGIKQPNCLPCPAGFKAEAGKALEKKDCKADPCPVQGQLRFFDGNCFCPQAIGVLIIGTDGSKSCGKCPAGTTQTQGGTEPTGEIQFNCVAATPITPTRQEDKSGACDEALEQIGCAALITGGLVLIGCVFKFLGLCNEQSTPEPKTTITQPRPVGDLQQSFRYTLVPVRSGTATSACTNTNEVYASDLEQLRVQRSGRGDESSPTHQHGKRNFVWVETTVKDAKVNGKYVTKEFKAATLRGETEANASLKCLVTRFATASGTGYGSSEFIKALRDTGVLHGINQQYKAECYNISKLVSYLNSNGNSITNAPKSVITKYLLKRNNVPVGKFDTKEEAIQQFNTIRANYRGTAANQATATYEDGGKEFKVNSNKVEADSFSNQINNQGSGSYLDENGNVIQINSNFTNLQRDEQSNQNQINNQATGSYLDENGNVIQINSDSLGVQTGEQTNTQSNKVVDPKNCLSFSLKYTELNGQCVETSGFLSNIFSTPKVSAEEGDLIILDQNGDAKGAKEITDTDSPNPEGTTPDGGEAGNTGTGEDEEITAEKVELGTVGGSEGSDTTIGSNGNDYFNDVNRTAGELSVFASYEDDGMIKEIAAVSCDYCNKDELTNEFAIKGFNLSEFYLDYTELSADPNAIDNNSDEYNNRLNDLNNVLKDESTPNINLDYNEPSRYDLNNNRNLYTPDVNTPEYDQRLDDLNKILQ